MIPTLTVDADAWELDSTWAAAVAAPTRTTSAISAPTSPIRRPRFIDLLPFRNRNLTPDSGIRLRRPKRRCQGRRADLPAPYARSRVNQRLQGLPAARVEQRPAFGPDRLARIAEIEESHFWFAGRRALVE